jgi:hypothetical protein
MTELDTIVNENKDSSCFLLNLAVMMIRITLEKSLKENSQEKQSCEFYLKHIESFLDAPLEGGHEPPLNRQKVSFFCRYFLHASFSGGRFEFESSDRRNARASFLEYREVDASCRKSAQMVANEPERDHSFPHSFVRAFAKGKKTSGTCLGNLSAKKQAQRQVFQLKILTGYWTGFLESRI